VYIPSQFVPPPGLSLSPPDSFRGSVRTEPEPATTDDTEQGSAKRSASPEPIVLGRENQSKAPGLPQSEITGNEEDYDHKANNVDNTVHVSSFFLSRDRIYFILKLEPYPFS
jgi:hypothetical protein